MIFYKKCIISTIILLLIFLFFECIFEGSCYTSNDNDLEKISTIDQKIESVPVDE